MRYFWTILILLCTLAWLVLSYSPALSSHLPTISFGSADFGSVGFGSAGFGSAGFGSLDTGVALPMTGAAAALLALCIGIQAWLVYATVRVLRRPQEERLAAALQLFRLNTRSEALLTALPLLMTLALAAVALFGPH